jgi:hypothetical protein
LPEPQLTAADRETIAAWLVNASKSGRARLLERLPRYVPELGWRAPDLTRLLEADFAPIDPTTPPVLGADDLEALAGDWLVYQETFWAWEELRRIAGEDPSAGIDRSRPLEDLL